MKDRDPASLSAAALRMVQAMGVAAVGEIVHRSPTLIYKWSDPDLAYYPNLQQALALDRVYIGAGHGAPPFLTSYSALLKLYRPSAKTGEPLQHAVKLIAIVAELVAEITLRIQEQPSNEAAANARLSKIRENLRRIAELQSALVWTIESNPQPAE